MNGPYSVSDLLTTAVAFAALSFMVISIRIGLPAPDRMDTVLPGQTLSNQDLAALSEARSTYFNELHELRAQRARAVLSGVDRDNDPRPTLKLPKPQRVFSVSDKLIAIRAFLLQPPNGDEGAPYAALANIRPRELKFDPHFYNYGGAFLYPIGGFLYFLGQLNILYLDSDISFYADHPSEITNMYLFGRSVNIFYFSLLMLAIWVTTRTLATPRAAALAVSAIALSPLTWQMSLSTRPHVLAALLFLAGVLSLIKYRNAPKRGWLFAAAVAIGLASGAALPAAIGWVIFPIMLWRCMPVPRWIYVSFATGVGVVLLYIVTNPFAVLSFPEFAANFLFHATSDRYDRAMLSVSKLARFGTHLLYAYCFPVSLLGLIGFVYFSIRLRTEDLRRVSIAGLLLLVGAGATIAEPRIVFFIGPLVCISGAVVLDKWVTSTRAFAGAAIIALVPGLASATIFMTDTLRESERFSGFDSWLSQVHAERQHTSIGLLSRPIPHYFPPFPILRQELIYIGDGTETPSRLPAYVLVSSPDESIWRKHPIRHSYRLVARDKMELLPRYMRIGGIRSWRETRRPHSIDVYSRTNL